MPYAPYAMHLHPTVRITAETLHATFFKRRELRIRGMPPIRKIGKDSARDVCWTDSRRELSSSRIILKGINHFLRS